MPDDVAEEKVKALEALGATVERVRPASIVDKKQVRLSQFPPFSIFLITGVQYVVSVLLPPDAE
jgi:hypothetical protein